MTALQKKYKAQIAEMVETCHAIALRQYVTSHGGNMSWRVGPEDVLITPTRVNKGRMTAQDICIVAMDGGVRYAAKGRKPTGESYIHLGIMRKRPDIASIVHAHPAWLTALAISKPELLAQPWLPEPIIEVGPVAVAEYAEPLTEELARTFDAGLPRHNAFLMRNHGALVMSVDGVARCFELLEMLETTAKSVAIAQMIGGAKPLPKSALKGLAKTMRTRNLRMPGAPGQVKDLTDLFDI